MYFALLQNILYNLEYLFITLMVGEHVEVRDNFLKSVLSFYHVVKIHCTT